ncbi:ATP-binding protein [Methanolapillus ohkumae]|uniref:Transcriptional regulator n=1 Tax=Methanolapillus ohkumae TaxID=3028298 RepID=A0AA96V4T8_9EURY|nr:hypothetical protein MsAm2_03760 [Methanosarcinaceae archaeon Am2]
MTYSEVEINEMFQFFLDQPHESEILEFKEAKKDFDFRKLGKYFSALSNEENLKSQKFAWLIFGVEDKTHHVVGTSYRSNSKNLISLYKEIADKTIGGITFTQIYEINPNGLRVLLFQIPAAPKGIPTSFDGHYFGRNGESLDALSLSELEMIRSQSNSDWSAEIILSASLDDLDSEAILKARENYKTKYPGKVSEIDSWDDITFLNKAKVTTKGKITRTALILLGKDESEHFLNPANLKIRWILKDIHNQDKDYEIFTIPFLLAVDKVNLKIRNLKYRYIREGAETLFPEEVLKYEPFVIREALNNCIAHQDYQKGGMINVIEINDEELIFTNYGRFIPGSVEKVVTDDAPEESNRNKFLATAMFNLNMVDTIGSGIKKMFNFQRQRFFPMPEYDLNNEKVKVTIIGKILDVEFAHVLTTNPDLSLENIILLDKVQKKNLLSDEEAKHLKKLNLIEGRKPNYFISSEVAFKSKNSNLKAEYINQRGFDDGHYMEKILDYLMEYGSATRSDINALLLQKLPESYNTDEKKKNKINNLLGSLTRSNKIMNKGSRKVPIYVLIPSDF